MSRTARMHPIHIHQVQIQILVPTSPPPSTTSYILPTLPHYHQPTTTTTTTTATATKLPQPPLRLDDINLKPNLPPEQLLLHSQTLLTPTHQQTLSSYLHSSLSFPSLRRLATHLSIALTTSPPPPPRIQRSLEQRAHLVADATVSRAQAPTTAPRSQPPPSPPPSSRNNSATTTPSPSHLHHLKTQHLALVHALPRLDQRIRSYSTSDPQAAHMLIPIRAQMRVSLRQVSALLLAYGQSLTSPSHSTTRQNAAGAHTPHAVFVPQTPDHVLLHSESDIDESDLAAAVRLPSHCFRVDLSRGRNYDSADSDVGGARMGAYDNGGDVDNDDDAGSYDSDAAPSIATALQANFVIDLDAPSSAPSWGIFGGRMSNRIVAPRQEALMHQEIIMHSAERYGSFLPFGGHHVQRAPLLVEEDGYSGDLDDLEQSAERRRNRIRNYGRVVGAVSEKRSRT